MRTAFPLCDSWIGSKDELLQAMVRILGRLPDPVWSAWERHTYYFNEDGTHRDVYACQISLKGRVREIGVIDEEEEYHDDSICYIETTKVRWTTVGFQRSHHLRRPRYRSGGAGPCKSAATYAGVHIGRAFASRTSLERPVAPQALLVMISRGN